MLILFLIIYLLSFLSVYFWTKNAHNPGGVYYPLKPELNDFLLTILPVFNTVSIFVFCIFFSLNGKEKYNSNWYKKFFKVK